MKSLCANCVQVECILSYNQNVGNIQYLFWGEYNGIGLNLVT